MNVNIRIPNTEHQSAADLNAAQARLLARIRAWKPDGGRINLPIGRGTLRRIMVDPDFTRDQVMDAMCDLVDSGRLFLEVPNGSRFMKELAVTLGIQVEVRGSKWLT